MKMKTLDRIRKVQDTWEYVMLSLEIINYVSQGELARSIHRAISRQTNDLQHKKPATIKVKSERGTSRE
jgi:hypothetical protein